MPDYANAYKAAYTRWYSHPTELSLPEVVFTLVKLSLPEVVFTLIKLSLPKWVFTLVKLILPEVVSTLVKLILPEVVSTLVKLSLSQGLKIPNMIPARNGCQEDNGNCAAKTGSLVCVCEY